MSHPKKQSSTLTQLAESDSERMLPTPEVLRTLGIKSDDTLRRMVRKNGFPKPYRITSGKSHWALSEVQGWLQERMSEQRGVAA